MKYLKSKITKIIRRLVGNQELNLRIEQISKQLNEHNKILNEVLKAEKFHDSIIDSKWLKQKTFAPGRGAIDYSALYTIYRILDIMHPRSILEFGLGQSSRLIQQYTNAFIDVEAITVEHDKEWVDVFLSANAIPYNMNIEVLDIDYTTYKTQKVLSYKNIEKVQSKKYDFIFVDGPYGYLGYYYSRPQILSLVDNLSDEFCVVFDDYNRIGEKNTVEEFCYLLQERKRTYSKNVFYGEKEHVVISTAKFNMNYV